MAITFDQKKRDETLSRRGLAFEDAAKVFAGDTIDFEDIRKDYGEDRHICIGYLEGRMVVVVWTPRGGDRHVISMRKANEREKVRYR